nr:hypothetical protein [Tychonema sp. LEGE 07203]
MLVVGCWLLVVGCWLLVIGYCLFLKSARVQETGFLRLFVTATINIERNPVFQVVSARARNRVSTIIRDSNDKY